MAHAAAHGCPVPAVHGVEGPDLDVAVTALIVAQVSLSTSPPLSAAAERVLPHFLRHT